MEDCVLKIDRRVFLERLTALVGGFPLAHRLLGTTGGAATLLPRTREMGVEALPVKFPGEGATLAGYLARPKGSGPYPAIIIRGRSGLTDSVRDRARRYAEAGFVALAVDPLSCRGGTASFPSPEAAQNALATLTEAWLIADLAAAREYLRRHPLARGDHLGLISSS